MFSYKLISSIYQLLKYQKMFYCMKKNSWPFYMFY